MGSAPQSLQHSATNVVAAPGQWLALYRNELASPRLYKVEANHILWKSFTIAHTSMFIPLSGWHRSSAAPRFMQHLISVERIDSKRSHWIAKGPLDRQVEWDAEVINEIRNELIAWRSLPGSTVDSAGSVRFKDAPGGRGTEVRVELQYNPP